MDQRRQSLGPRTDLTADSKPPVADGIPTLPGLALDLQRTAGNRATAALLARQPRRTNRLPEFGSVPAGMRPTAKQLAARLQKTLGIKVRPDRILDAPWVSNTIRQSTSTGYLRSPSKFWKAYKARWPEEYKLLGRGHRVTKAFAERMGWPSKTVGQRLVHHHIGHSSLTVALPEGFHEPAGIHGKIHGRATVFRIKPGLRFVAGAAASFGAFIVKGLLAELPAIAVAAFVAHMEGKLDKVNQEQIARDWGGKVGKVIAPELKRELAEVAKNDQRHKHRLYVTVPWQLVMQEQSRGLGDAAWWLLRFIGGQPGFSEVFEEVRLPKQMDLLWTLKRPKRDTGRRRPREYKEQGWTYRVYDERTTILVSDPAVWQIVEQLEEVRSGAEALLEEVFDEIELLGGTDWATIELQATLREEDYGAAAKVARELAGTLWEEHGSQSDDTGGALRELAVHCEEHWRQLIESYRALDREQRVLLASYAPGFPSSAPRRHKLVEQAAGHG